MNKGERKVKMKTLAIALMLSGVASHVTAAPATNSDAAVKARVDMAKQTTREFLQQLGGILKKEMKANGPAAAMSVCRNEAPRIANEISLSKGWTVTRVGTRVRNPMLGVPDSWEQGVLKEFEARAAKGESLKDMAYYEVVDEPAGKSLRFMKAIGVKSQCLVCHGDKQNVAAPVQAQLNNLYPHDRATGYQKGDLRGAVSIKQPLVSVADRVEKEDKPELGW